MDKIIDLSVKTLAEELRKKSLSAEEATKAYLAEISEKEPEIGAYITVTEDKAFARAREIDAKRKKGETLPLLAGIPAGIKDNICTKGVKTTCASKMLGDFEPPYDATVMEKLNDAGMVMLGKLNMDEFAMGSTTENSHFHSTRNPMDLERVPGGSSGGAAAAVAAGLCAYGLGTDTGGSIRQPAAFCGIVGIKPTYGAVSRFGAIAYASSFDQIGVLASSAEDASVVFNAMSGYDEADSTCVQPGLRGGRQVDINADVKGRKIAFIKECFDGLPDDIKSAVMAAVKDYEALGAEIIEVSVPGMAYALPVYYILACAEASSNLGRYDGIRYGHRTDSYLNINEMIMKTRTEGFGDEVKRRIMLGTYVLSSGYYDAYYKKGLRAKTLIKKAFDEAFEQFDMILAPTAPTTAFPIGQNSNDPLKLYLGDIYTAMVNIAGLPALSAPCGFDRQGLPVGFQLIGRAFDETRLLQAAYAFQRETGFHKQFPVLGGKGGDAQ